MNNRLLDRVLATDAGFGTLALRIPIGIIFGFCGCLALLSGGLVLPGAAALAVAMLVAIFSVHIDKGLFVDKNGYEYALALLAASVALLISGAGRVSLDRAIATRSAAR